MCEEHTCNGYLHIKLTFSRVLLLSPIFTCKADEVEYSLASKQDNIIKHEDSRKYGMIESSSFWFSLLVIENAAAKSSTGLLSVTSSFWRLAMSASTALIKRTHFGFFCIASLAHCLSIWQQDFNRRVEGAKHHVSSVLSAVITVDNLKGNRHWVP